MMMISTMRMTTEQPPSHIFIFIFLGRRGVNVMVVIMVVITVVISKLINWTQQL